VPTERLQKLIAHAGVCSRREAEELVLAGRVTVNGRTAVIGDQADPDKDAIKIDGKRLRAAPRQRYILLFKPAAVVTTTSDPEERTTVVDLVRGRVGEKVYPIGRLDYHSEGLVILTNDGDFAMRVAHPRFCVMREYLVKVRGVPDEAARQRLQRGTVIEGTRVVPKVVEMTRPTGSGLNSWWRVVVGEGKTHEVRELFKRIGHPVQRLVRVAIGPVRDEALRPGGWRELTPAEVEALWRGGRAEGRGNDVRASGAGIHQEAVGLRAGKADRGGPARVGGDRHRQARQQRESPRDLPAGARSHRARPAEPQPLPRRQRVRAAQGPRRSPRS
jgi:23S rRNA pseudouridine2605 synthase